jgi:4-hydroxy-4-methyl-2-oxoglutarate aldolase
MIPSCINATITRTPADLVERFKLIKAEIVAERVGRSQRMSGSIKPLVGRDWRIVGPAVTVQLEHIDLLTSVASIAVAKPGDVIVIAAQGMEDAAVWGGGLSLSARNTGVEGVVLDGLVLDAPSILQREVPVFCRGSTMIHAPSERMGSINVPVACGGVIVNPGDLILGDLDGVMVLRPDQAAAMIDDCETKAAMLRQRAADLLSSGQTMIDVSGGIDWLKSFGSEWNE